MSEAVAITAFNRQVRRDSGEFNLSRSAVVLRDRGLHTGLGYNDWFDVEAGHELNVVHRKDVRGIDHCERERSAHARQRQHGVFLRDFLWNESQDRVIDVKEFQVNRGNAVLSRQHGGDCVVGDQAQLDQVEAQPAAMLTLIIQRLTQVLGTD